MYETIWAFKQDCASWWKFAKASLETRKMKSAYQGLLALPAKEGSKDVEINSIMEITHENYLLLNEKALKSWFDTLGECLRIDRTLNWSNLIHTVDIYVPCIGSYQIIREQLSTINLIYVSCKKKS